MKIAISPGHGTRIRGAAGPAPWGCDEVNECQAIVPVIARYSREAGAQVVEIVDHHSTTQDQNLAWLVDQHNAAFGGDHGNDRLDVSVHMNAYQITTTTPRGTEVWFATQEDLAEKVASEIAIVSGLIDRGAKSDSLYFLSNTASKAILIELAFCDSKPDCDTFRRFKDEIAYAIAEAIIGQEISDRPPIDPPATQPPEGALFYARGTCSWFGGPEDDGVSANEGLAFFYQPDECPHLMLRSQPPGTTGMARRLDPGVMYLACRWDYARTPKEMLRDQTRKALVRAGNKEFLAYPADWGPHEEQTGRAADLSPALMEALELETDDEVEVIYPA